MSLENSEKQELNTNEPNKISLSDEDKEFIQMLRLAYPRVSRKTPSWVKKNVMDAYAKEYRYQILWRTSKLKVIEYKEVLFGTRSGLEIALVSTVILFILGGIIYYQYIDFKQKKGSLIVKQQPEIKMSPNSTDTPVVTPTPIIIDPNIAKISENNQNNVDQRKTVENSEHKIKNKIRKTNKNKIENSQLDNQVTHNNSNDNVIPIEDLSKKIDRGSIIKDPSLLNMKNFYLGINFGNTQEDKELREYLDLKLKTTDLKILTSSESFTEIEYGEITKREDLIEIYNNRTKKLLWRISLRKMAVSPKEQANKIVQQLIDDIKK